MEATKVMEEVSIRTSCCKKWYECSECHDEHEAHHQQIDTILAFTCKTCKKIFFKDLSIYAPEDKACPQCNTVFIQLAITPEAKVAELAIDLLHSELKSFISKI